MRIGWIGLGKMGSLMAARLLDAGHELVVYNRSHEKTAPLAERGARVAATPAEAANAEIVVTMLANDAALRSVLDVGGALAAMPPDGIHVSMSTIGYALAQELTQTHSARGVHFVGAPVFGRPEAAERGHLYIVVGGAAGAIERCQALLGVLGQKILQLGPEPGAAHLCKVLGNFMLISSVELLGEALNVVQAAGLSPEAILSALTGSVFTAPFYANYGRMILAQNFDSPAGFALPLAGKDLDLALAAAAQAHVTLPVAETVRQKIAQVTAEVGENVDVTAIGRFSRSQR